jgi:tetraacyldisaccharide 4'-kinase
MKANLPVMGRRPRLERYWRPDLSVIERIMWSAMVPAAAAYRAAMALRAGFWRLPGLRQAADVRVISVGNLTVGGNAKTPFCLYLARKLAEHGAGTAIVSRGYGGSLGSGAPVLVSDGRSVRLSAEEAGDEAVMMARAFDGPVAIARWRIDAINLLKQHHAALEIVILDDGFQHLRLARDVDLLLVNAERGFGNGWTLPAGPLREGIGAAARANAVVILSAGVATPSRLNAAQMTRLQRVTVLRGLIEPGPLVFAENGRWREAPAHTLGGRRILAVSGLADPASFYAMLRGLEADLVGVLEYPDHYQYTAADWQNIRRAAASAELVVTTEKDLVKLERFPFPRNSIAALRLEISMGADEQRLLLMALGVDRQSSRPLAEVKRGASNGG